MVMALPPALLLGEEKLTCNNSGLNEERRGLRTSVLSLILAPQAIKPAVHLVSPARPSGGRDYGTLSQ